MSYIKIFTKDKPMMKDRCNKFKESRKLLFEEISFSVTYFVNYLLVNPKYFANILSY